MKLSLRNYLLLILLSLLTLLLFSCETGIAVNPNPPTTPSVPSLAIDYGISKSFYIALTNAALELIQKENFGSQSRFSVSPSLPSGLSLDITNGNISGTPTTVSLPTPYTITATKDSKTYTNIISLGVAPSVVWVTNTNSTKPYEFTAFVVGDHNKQTGVSWSSSDTALATVNNGIVDLKTSPIGGTVEIIATATDGNTDKVAFNVAKTAIGYGSNSFYITLLNSQVGLVQNSQFSSTVFSVNPTLPSGLTLDTASGSISGTPTLVMLPSQYTIIATVGRRSQTNMFSLGVAPSVVWVTNTNSTKPYEFTTFVVGDRTKQTGISWSSSDTALATVSNGIVDLKTSPIGGTVEIIATTTDGNTGKITFNVPSTSIDYGTSNFYIALVNNQIDLIQNTVLNNPVFSVNPALPNGLTLDTANGNISGIPTIVSLPNPYTLTATADGKNYTKAISLGIAPKMLLVTNTNSTKPYEFTALVVGDRTKQTGVSWSSSDTALATVNNGVVDLKTSPIGGTVEITATTTDGNTEKVTFNVAKTSIDYGTNNFYITLLNSQVDLVQNSQFSSTVFSANPALPSGLTLDAASGSISGTPTLAMLPSEYTIIATVGARSQTNIVSLGVAPSVVWVTNTNSVDPYQLSTYIVGNRAKQTRVSWSSSDTSISTVNNNGVVSFKETTTGGVVEIIATTTDGDTGKITFNVAKVENVSGGQIVSKDGDVHLTIYSSVRDITSAQFASKDLTRVTIPDSVETIGTSAFNVNKLTSVVLPNRLRSINDFAFQQNLLTNLVIGSSLRTLGTAVFRNNRITSLVISNGLTNISTYVFDINQLTNVYIPDSVSDIGNNAFTKNPNLVQVSLKQSLYNTIVNNSSTNAVFGTQVTNYIKRP